MSKKNDSELVSNRKATYEYEILDTWEAGIVLVGTEIKSLRNHGGSLQDSYVLVSKGEVILKNASISPYKFGNLFNHEERRDRKLLLHKREIEKLYTLSQEKGLTLIPLGMFLKNGFVKVKIACCRGKKLHDKRASIKEREHKKAIDRALRDHG
ncbi:MAG: SsrA-binding protein SmpB [Parachlamydiales bacterium]|nr:SsrA-binding protein SmpB [Verrucomicrobiota bacterium]MBX3719865.1 SsrA-binding protein SmpB [Candidatus Acheromyda pituitae]